MKPKPFSILRVILLTGAILTLPVLILLFGIFGLLSGLVFILLIAAAE